jgi:hypothetical protein
VGNFDELEVGSDEVLVGGDEAKTLESVGMRASRGSVPPRRTW